MTGLTPPAVPEAALDAGGWGLEETEIQTLADRDRVTVRGATVRYEDERSRRALRKATDGAIDHPLRFFTASELEIDTVLPESITPTLFGSKIRSEVRKAFVTRLETEGLVDVDRNGRDRVRLPNRNRIRFRNFEATDRVTVTHSPEASQEQIELPLECKLGVWINSGTVTVLSGGYPLVSPAEAFEIDADGPIDRSPQGYEDEFLELVEEVVEIATTDDG